MALSITGMHRSGTSLMTFWLKECGLIIDQGRVIPPLPGNPKGFFEDLDFVELQEKSISRQFLFSGGWKVASKGNLHFSKTEKDIARKLISIRQNRLGKKWGWKDPRTSLFLLQWRELIPDLKTLVVWRPCEQVVHSMVRRWKRKLSRKLIIDPVWAVRVWKAYNKVILRYADSFPENVVILPLEELLKNDQAVFDLIQERFDLEISYKALSELYEPNLLTQKTPAYLGKLSALMGVEKIEEQLQSINPF